MRARLRLRHETGRANKAEAAYAQNLTLDPEVHSYLFESIKLRLADNTWYTPDFAVLYRDGRMELHEVKVTWKRKSGELVAGWEEDAKIKYKVAAEAFPWFIFRVARQRHKSEGAGFELTDA
jgi:hypothetical protein